MGVRKTELQQTASGAWVADSTIETELVDEGLITEINVTAEITPSATLAASNQPDALNRIIQGMQIVGGSHTYFVLPTDDGAQGGTLLRALNGIDGYGIGHGGGAVAAPHSTYTAINFVFHAGSRPRMANGARGQFDLTAFIPAGNESRLVARWSTSGADVLDDTVTIASAVMRYTISSVNGTEQELRTEMARQGVRLPPGATGMIPAWSALNHTNGGVTTDFAAETEDIVAGAYLRRISMLCQDATAIRPARSSDEVVEFAIVSIRNNQTLLQVAGEISVAHGAMGTFLTANDAVSFGGVHNLDGVLYADFRGRGSTDLHDDYGWNLIGSGNGSFKLGLKIRTQAAGDRTLILFERVSPIDGLLAA